MFFGQIGPCIFSFAVKPQSIIKNSLLLITRFRIPEFKFGRGQYSVSTPHYIV